MQTALEALQPQLVVAQAKVEDTVKIVESEKAEAAEVEKIVMVDEEVSSDVISQIMNVILCMIQAANEQAKAAQAIKDECEANMAEAMPILNSALAALNTLTPADITIVKTMKNPPKGVKLVMEAVCILKVCVHSIFCNTHDFLSLKGP